MLSAAEASLPLSNYYCRSKDASTALSMTVLKHITFHTFLNPCSVHPVVAHGQIHYDITFNFQQFLQAGVHVVFGAVFFR